MNYNRPYSFDEVTQFLIASEHRPRPDLTGPGVPSGHAISLHTSERKDVFSRPGAIPKKDSIFMVARNSLVAMVHEALNSNSGQRELEKLNAPSVKSAKINCVILRQGPGFDIFTVYRPADGKQSSFDWLSTTKGDGFIVQVFVLVYKIPNSPTGALHIQTVFPIDFARTAGDEIIWPR
jgi:hypothetical protein